MSVEPTWTHAADDPPTRTHEPAEAGSTRTHSADDPARTGTFDSHPVAQAPIPVIPGYDILDVLGEGGMGRVYRARQHATDRIVALKVLLAGELASAAARDRFRAEVTATATLSHSHIVQVFEAGEADGRAFLVCEYVAGGSLAARLDGTPWDAARAARMIGPLARAVAAAHHVGIIHRDLKPANVLMTADGTPKLADFGIAKRLDSDSKTQTGAVLGTPSYMAPEQAGGSKEVGPAADVYGLGAILYELLTGRPPFRGKDFVETIDLVRTQEPVPPRVFQPKLPRDIETICLKCVQKDPAKRYASAEALAEDLDRFLEHRPIQARPVSGIERAWRWCRRNRAVASLLATVVLVSVTGAIIAAGLAKESSEFARSASKNAGDAERREKEANEARQRADGLLEETEELLYSARIGQAHTAAKEHHTTRLTEMLEAAKPQPGRPDRRGWEWHYLNRLAHSWEHERTLDMSSPTLATFDPRKESLFWRLAGDGRRVLVRGNEMFQSANATRAGLFDLATGRLIRDLPELKDVKRRGQFSEAMDPEMRFLAWAENTIPAGGKQKPRWCVKLMNLDTGAIETPSPDVDELPGLHVAPGGNRIVMSLRGSEYDKTQPRLEVWDRARAEPRRVPFPVDGVYGPATTLLGISPDTTACVFLFASPKKDGNEYPHFSFWKFAPGGLLGNGLWKRGRDHSVKETYSVQFSPGGRMFAHVEGTAIGIYDALTGAKAGRFVVPPGQPQFIFPHLSDDGRRLAFRWQNESLLVAERIGEAPAAGKPAVAVEWRTSTLRAPLLRSDGLTDGTLRLSGDGRWVSVASVARAWEWDLTRGEFAASWPERMHWEGETRLAFPAPRGRWVHYHGVDFTSNLAVIYDARERRIVRKFVMRGADGG